MASKKSQEDTRKKTEVQKDRIFRHETEVPAEREFGDIDGEVEPASGADHDHFGVALGEKVESGDGAGGVGNHGGHASGPATAEAQHGVGSHPSEELGARALEANDSDEDENDPTQSMAKKLRGDAGHQPPPGDDADCGGGDKCTESLPRGVFVEGTDGEDIGKNEQEENHSRGLIGRHHLGHKENGEQTKGSET